MCTAPVVQANPATPEKVAAAASEEDDFVVGQGSLARRALRAPRNRPLADSAVVSNDDTRTVGETIFNKTIDARNTR